MAGGAAVAAASVPALLGLSGGRSGPVSPARAGTVHGFAGSATRLGGPGGRFDCLSGTGGTPRGEGGSGGPDGVRTGCRGAGAHGLVVLRRTFRSHDGRPRPRERPSRDEPVGEDLERSGIGPPVEVGRRRASRGGGGLRDRGGSFARAGPRNGRAPRKGRFAVESRPGTARGRGARCMGGADRGRATWGPGLLPEAVRR